MSYRLYELESLMRDANVDLDASRKRIGELETLVGELQHRVRESDRALKFVEKLFAREAALRSEVEYQRDRAIMLREQTATKLEQVRGWWLALRRRRPVRRRARFVKVRSTP